MISARLHEFHHTMNEGWISEGADASMMVADYYDQYSRVVWDGPIRGPARCSAPIRSTIITLHDEGEDVFHEEDLEGGDS